MLALRSVDVPTWKPLAWSAWMRLLPAAVAVNSSVLSPASDYGRQLAKRPVTVSFARTSTNSGWKPTVEMFVLSVLLPA